jgi:hypothetical protein
LSTDLVRYACRAKAHLEASRHGGEAAGSPVTIHEGAWAYCPAGAHAEHEWEPIEPVTLADLKLVEVVRPRETAPEDSRS